MGTQTRKSKKKSQARSSSMPIIGGNARVEARVTDEEKAILKKAADLLHLSLSDFVRTEIIPRAEEVVESRQKLSLNNEESEAFVKGLLDMPKDASRRFNAGAKRYKEAKKKGII